MAKKSDSCMDADPVKALATKHSKTPAQILLRWAVQRGTAVIPKSNNPGRMVENADIFGFSLTDEEMGQLDALDQGRRFNDPGQYGEFMFKKFFPIFE